MRTTSPSAAVLRAVIRPREYFDSVFLMRVSDRLAKRPGILDAAVVMATEANRARLVDAGLMTSEVERAGPDDLVVVLRSDDPQAADATLAEIDHLLRSESIAPDVPRTLAEAVAVNASANVALISVPGEHAGREAHKAIELGLHAFVFSGNVPLADERALKEDARAKGLLVMGPDCGTAIIRGIGLGFANAVRRGRIGVVGASGTGIQEITTLVHRAGGGISHALGTGSHDPTDAVGGISTLAAFAALVDDPETDVIVLVSKTPGPKTRASIADAVARSPKRVVTCFVGEAADGRESTRAPTLEAAAALALGLGSHSIATIADPEDIVRRLDSARSRLTSRQTALHGLFAGGSFALEAGTLLREAGVRPEDLEVIDLGAERFTEGRPHPMIDPRYRRDRILAASEDPRVAVVLFDVILGHGVAVDPAGDLVDAIEQARHSRDASGGDLAFVASLTGTADDPQGLQRQEATLAAAGVIVLPTTARAARAAGSLVGGARYE